MREHKADGVLAQDGRQPHVVGASLGQGAAPDAWNAAGMRMLPPATANHAGIPRESGRHTLRIAKYITADCR